MSASHGISLHITIYIDPTNVPAFFAAFKPVFDAIVAEPELISFEVYQSSEEPGKLSWVENWNATWDWIVETQLKKEYYVDYFATTEAMFIKPREIKVFDRLGPPYFVVKKETS